MRILVTGHSGLLGSHLVPMLQEKGHEVLGVSRTDRMGMKENIFLTDLTDANAVEFIFKNFKPEVVYHLAACASEAKGQVSPIDMTQRNLLLTTNIVRSAVNVGVKKIIYSSSVSVYGDVATPYVESSYPHPKDVYGVNKLAGEQMLKIMAKVYGFEYTILRPHNLYGPGQNQNDLTKNVINIFMRRILENKSYTIMGEGTVCRGFSYAEDVAKVFLQVLDSLSETTMNVGTNSSHTIQELSDLLQEITKANTLIERLPLRKQEIDVFIADHYKQGLLVRYAETPLKKGLQKTWNWMKEQTLGPVVTIPEEIYVHA